MEDEDEGDEDDPVELVDQPEVRSSIFHQPVVGEDDEESTEKDVEQHGIHVHISRGEPGLSDRWEDERTGRQKTLPEAQRTQKLTP